MANFPNFLHHLISSSRPGFKRSKIVVGSHSLPNWKVDQHFDFCIYLGMYIVFRSGGYILYQTPGKIVVYPQRPTDVYIYNPPPKVRRLPQGPCLQLVSPQNIWFKLHWDRPAYTFEESCAYIESLLNQVPARDLILAL